jgi:hypothetical protein
VLTKKNAYDQFAKRVVASLLVDGSNSPMYQVRCLVRISRYVFNIREPYNRGVQVSIAAGIIGQASSVLISWVLVLLKTCFLSHCLHEYCTHEIVLSLLVVKGYCT